MIARNRILAIALLVAGTAPVFPQAPADRFAGNQALQEVLAARHAVYVQTFEDYFGGFFLERPEAAGSVYDVAEEEALPAVREILDRGIGLSAFLLEMNFGFDNQPDKIAVIPLTDQLELLAVMGIQGNDFQIGNEQIIQWFTKWSTEFDFRIVGVGIDFIWADILTPPDDWDALAAEIYSMCPDVVDQGTDTVEELAAEMRSSMTMFFWWD